MINKKSSIIKKVLGSKLEEEGFDFHLGLDDHGAVVGLMHNHGMFMAQVWSEK